MLNRLLRGVRLTILLLGLAVSGGYAQKAPPVKVRGLVLSAVDHRPIPGAGVFVTQTGLGTSADVIGAFQLTIQRTDTLVVRAIGFQPRQFTVKPNAPAEFAIEVVLNVDSVQLGEVRILADRPDRPEINRALRAIRRPSTAPAMAHRSVGKPIFAEPTLTGPPPPTLLANPVDFLYEEFSRAGRNRRKLAQWEADRAAEQAAKRQQEYNKAFKENQGFE